MKKDGGWNEEMGCSRRCMPEVESQAQQWSFQVEVARKWRAVGGGESRGEPECKKPLERVSE